MEPRTAALWSLIAICFVMIGAILTAGVVPIEQRAVVLGGTIAILLAVGYRIRRGE